MKTISSCFQNKTQLSKFINEHSLDIADNLLVQAFSSSGKNEDILKLQEAIATLLPQAVLIGATTDAAIMNGRVSVHKTVLSFTQFEKISIRSAVVDYEADSFESGRRLAGNLIDDETKALILFADSLHINGEDFLKGVASLGSDAKISGGMAGGSGTHKKTSVFTKNTLSSNGAVGVALSGDRLYLHTMFNFNWHPIGKIMTVTKADKNRLYTIDGATAFDTYAYYLGVKTKKLLLSVGVCFPLILRRGRARVARTVIDKMSDGSLIFGGNIAEGDKVQFGYGDGGLILEESIDGLKDMQNRPIESIFVFSDMGRKHFMPDVIENEISPLQNFGPVSGFFTDGEFYDFGRNKEFLNQSMTIIAMSESPVKNRKVLKSSSIVPGGTFPDATRALTHLVDVATRELMHINDTLQELVMFEVDKNRKKDKIMFAQSKLAQMGELHSMIAHQWRQPLCAIGAVTSGIEMKLQMQYLAQSKEQEELNAYMKEKLGKINDYTRFLSRTIDDFRNFLKTDKQKSDVKLPILIDQVFEMLEDLIVRCKISVEKEYNDTGAVGTYQNEITHVIMNIIKNSIDNFLHRSVENPKITVMTKRSDEGVIIEISDNGGGIADEIITKIFNPYFSTKNEDEGMGLGLYMSKVIVSEHCEGDLSVYNKNEGACFKIILP